MEFLLLCLNTIVFGLIAILLFACYHFPRSFTLSKAPQPPKPGGAWPLLGHLPLLARSQVPHVTLGALADEYGPIFTIKLGLHQALVVSNWELAKELFTTYDVAVSTRPKFTASKHLSYNYVMFGLAPHGAYWGQMRKIITLELLSARRIELLKQVRITEVETSLNELHRIWTDRKNGLGHVLVDLQRFFGNLTLNVILKMVVGKRYFGSGAEGDEQMARRCQKAMRNFFHFLGLFVVRDAVPFLGWLDVGGHEMAMKRTAKEMDDIAGEWLEEHRRKRDSCAGESEEKDFMGVLLSTLDGTNLFGHDSDMVNKTACLNIIAGGDTTTVTLTWVVSLLLNNRHALKKAQEELDVHVGKERLVDESDISKLIYLQAIVKETLRLYPPAPLSGPREFSEDCTVGGYHVKKGTRLITNLSKIQKDPSIWPNAMEFKPERFLTSHKNIDVRGKCFELIPFGSGRRQCPGIALGLQMVHFILASFLHAFEISSPSKGPIDMTESVGLTNMKATPLEVHVSPRLPLELYNLQ